MRIYIIDNDGITLCREPPATVNKGEIAVGSREELHAARLSGKRLLQQQLSAEARRWLGFVESAPLLTKLAEIELGEARERLPASRCILDHAAHACSGAAMR